METRIAMGHLLGSDPRPHFVHQSNMTDDRILFPVLDSILDRYKTTFTEATPIVNPRMAEAGQALVRRTRGRTPVGSPPVSRMANW